MTAGPSSPELQAHRLVRAGCLEEALPFAQQAIAGTDVCVPAHGMLALILLRLGQAREAERVVLEALEFRDGGADAYDSLAYVSIALGRHERANALYKRALDLAPGTVRFWYNLASSERSFGRLLDAEAACNRAIALDAAHYRSYLLRSELRVQTAEFNHVRELQAQLDRPTLTDGSRVLLGYALGKELDDLGHFDEAYRWFSDAAQARRRRLSYDVAIDERKLQRIAEAYPLQLRGRDTSHRNSAQYVFIVGLPRSGTTLLERILTGLPGVRSNGETDNFARALMAAAPLNGGDAFGRAAAADPGRVAEYYAKLADRDASDGLVIEKLPMNYLYLGAIHLALPDAKLILVKRSALDSCFAMYRTLFGDAYPFSYDFHDLARYYSVYHRLMSHWRAALGDRMHEVDYECLVTEPDRVGASVARYCRIPWDTTALEIQKNAAVSMTASAVQIRRPIYRTSSSRWRHYRTHLEPLIAELRQRGIHVGDDA